MSQIIRRLQNGQEIHCIDTKLEIGPLFRKHINVVGIDAATNKFTELLNKAADRQKLFEETSERLSVPIRDYIEYFKYTKIRLPVITLFLEELIVLMSEIPEDLLIKLLVTGRSAGIYVVAIAQYIKADILSRKGTINFNTAVFLGQYDRISIGLAMGSLNKEDTIMLQQFLGTPGKAAILEQGVLKTVTMPRITDEMLIKYIRNVI